MNKNELKNSIIYSIIGVIFVFLLWFLLYLIVSNNYLIPSPLVIIKKSFKLLFNSEFYSCLFSTLIRVLIAVLISFTLGVFLSIISNLKKAIESVILPTISIMRSLPVLAVLLIILVFMPRTVAPIIVCVLSLLPIVYTQTLNYLKQVDPKNKEMLKLYKVPLKTQIFSVYLKGYLPNFISEITALFSFSLKLVVSAEILANVFKSIGGEISNASIYSSVNEMFALTLIICLIGIIVELLGKFIRSKMEKKYR